MTPVNLYERDERQFVSEGLGRIKALSGSVTREINGVYELQMEYPLDGPLASEITQRRWLYCPVDDAGNRQPFEIYSIAPKAGKMTVKAWHASYLLNKIVDAPFTASSASAAAARLKTAAMSTCEFDFYSMRQTTGTVNIKTPRSIKAAMMGMQGSLLDVFGGEWLLDGFTCSLRDRLGVTSAVTIKYGLNLISNKPLQTMSSFWTAVVAYWSPADDTSGSVVVSDLVRTSAAATYGDLTIPVDASEAFDSQPSQADLTSWAQSYATRNGKTTIPEQFTIDFVQLWQTEQYKDIAPVTRLGLGDTCRVIDPTLGTNVTARVMAYQYDFVRDRYSKMTIGQARGETFVTRLVKDIRAKEK